MSKPPYDYTTTILQLVGSIKEKLGEAKALQFMQPNTRLRKENRIRAIQASLEIEGNTLSLEQVTAVLENQRIAGPQKDILEVQNAIKVYNNLLKWKTGDETSFLKAHAMLMKNLARDAGQYRKGAVGIIKGDKLTHLAPPASRVPGLMKTLFHYINKSEEMPLIMGCVCHYEMAFIHPFSDGNGRMARLWQSLLFMWEDPVFQYLPIESLIRDRQKEYYHALGVSDKRGNSTFFIEFMLKLIDDTLAELLTQRTPKQQPQDRLLAFKEHIGNAQFSRKQYMDYFKTISTATASRDLALGVDEGSLRKFGEGNRTRYGFR